VDSIAPAPECKDVQHRAEVDCSFLEAGCEPSHVFHFAEEAFDDVALGVEIFVVGDRFSRIALRRNDGDGTFIGNLLPDLAAAVGFVGNNGEWLIVPVEKCIHHLAIVQISTAYFQA
jgi:hypothetical protein